MITDEVIKLASNTKFYGLKNNFTHKSFFKNQTCGDTIKIEIISKNKSFKIMRYETQSCIFCQASASILASSIKSFNINHLKKEIESLDNYFHDNHLYLPKKFNIFKKILKKDNLSRYDCIKLPFNALYKALKIKI